MSLRSRYAACASRSSRLALCAGLVAVTGLVQSGTAEAVIFPPIPLTLPSTILADLGGGWVAGDAAAAAAMGVSLADAPVIVGSAAAATAGGSAIAVIGAPIAVAVGGLAIGYGIGWTGVQAYRWAFSSSHVPNADVALGVGSYASAGYAFVPFGGTQTPYTFWDNDFLAYTARIAWSEPVYLTGFTLWQVPGQPGFTINEGTGDQSAAIAAMLADPGPVLGHYTLMDKRSGAPIDGYAVEVRLWDGVAGHPMFTALAAGDTTMMDATFPGGVPAVNPNPVRTLKVSALCESSAGVQAWVSATSAGYHETDATMPATPDVPCPAGSFPVEVHAVQLTSGLADLSLWDWTAPASLQNLPLTNPSCTGGGCKLGLAKLDPASGLKLDCFGTVGMCAKWQADPQKLDNYTCTWGGAVVALSQCNVYTPTFDTETPPTKLYNKDPTSDVDLNGETPPIPDPNAGCPPPMNWGLSLVSPGWYFKVGQCVFTWAFVPSADTVAQLRSLNADLKARPPFSLVYAGAGALGGLVDGFTGDSCSFLPDFDPSGRGRNIAALPCQPQYHGNAAWETGYDIAAIALSAFALFAIWKMATNALRPGADVG